MKSKYIRINREDFIRRRVYEVALVIQMPLFACYSNLDAVAVLRECPL